MNKPTVATTYTNGAGPHIAPEYTLEELELLAQAQGNPAPAEEAEPETEPSAPVFKSQSLGDLMNRPPKEWTVQDVMGALDLGVIYGLPGSGKTFVVIDLILSACLGLMWALRFAAARPLTVAYAAGEGLSGLPQRFAAAAEFYGVNELPNFHFFDNVPQLFNRNEKTGIIQFVNDWERQELGALDLLVIDTYHSAIEGANENASQDTGEILAAARYAMNRLGCSVLLVHHTDKGGNSERGSSALRGASDFMIEIKETGNRKFIMNCAKMKDGERWKSQTFDLVAKGESVRVWWDEPTDSKADERNESRERIAEVLREHADTALTAKAIAEATGQSQSNTTQILTKMVDAGEAKRELMDETKTSSNRNPWVYSWLFSSE